MPELRFWGNLGNYGGGMVRLLPQKVRDLQEIGHFGADFPACATWIGAAGRSQLQVAQSGYA